jgi:hypothetical protein
MTKKDQCKKIMEGIFGPATAAMVDAMDEATCVAQCRDKVKKFLGEQKAAVFDTIK